MTVFGAERGIKVGGRVRPLYITGQRVHPLMAGVPQPHDLGSETSPAKSCGAVDWTGRPCGGEMVVESLLQMHKGVDPLRKWVCRKCGRTEI